MDILLNRLVELEADVAYKTDPAPGEAEFGYTAGTIPVIISAPHGAAHQRNGRDKEEDEYTTGIARLVAEQTGAHAIYALRRAEHDPNFYVQAPYKRALTRIVQDNRIVFVLDLHGCAPDRPFGIGLGSMQGQSCPEQLPLILQALESRGYHTGATGLLRLDLDHTFTGGGGVHQETITRYAVNVLGVAALQVELNAHLRIVRRLPVASQHAPFSGDPALILNAIRILEDIVLAVDRSDGRIRSV